MAKSYGKYDDLSEDERRRLARASGLQAAAWCAASLALGFLDHRYGWRKQSLVFEWTLDVAYIAMGLRAIILTFRAISIQSPNPRRLPPKS